VLREANRESPTEVALYVKHSPGAEGSGTIAAARSAHTGHWGVWYGAAVIALYSVAVGLFLLARPGPLSQFQNIDNLTQILGPLLLAPLSFMAIRPLCRRASDGDREGHRDLRRWAPLFLVLGASTDAIAASIEFYYSAFSRQTIPVPSLADVAYFSTYLLWLAAILSLPVRPLAREARLRTVLDGLMLMAAVVTFSWYFVLGPTVLQSSQSYLSNAVAAGYPLGDLLLVLCLFLLMVRDGTPALRPVARLLALAFTSTIVADSVYASQMLKGLYVTGEVIDMGWPLSDMLVILAAYVLHRSLHKEEQSASAAADETGRYRIASAWLGLLPYLFVPLVGLLVIYISHDRGEPAPALKTGAYLCGGVLIGLVIVRQVLAILENSRLNRGLNEALAQSAAYAAELQELNERLMSAQEELRQNNRALVGANERLHALATTDPLTLLPNHRSMVSLLDQEIERARRYGHSCSVLFIDLDHFKALNDSYGHASGDDALRDLAVLFQATVRTMDTVGRWGGEEFVVLLPETDNAAAMGLAERVRDAVAHHFFNIGGGTQLTCSIGIATYPEDEMQRTKLVSAADKAMYVAKSLGRNQVRCAGEPAVLMLDLTHMHADPRQDAALIGTVDALVSLLGARDPSTALRSQQVGLLTARLALAIGLEAAEARILGLAGRLHDVGTVTIPDALLHKAGRLAEEEREIVRRRLAVATDVVGRIPALRMLVPLIQTHHEWWDGSGYPDGLSGSIIPIGARIIAVADAYVAMTTDRPHQPACSPQQAIKELQRCAGSQFDPAVVDALVRVVGAEQMQPAV